MKFPVYIYVLNKMMTIKLILLVSKSVRTFVANDDDTDVYMTSENDEICPPSWIDKLQFSKIRLFPHINPKPNRNGLKMIK